MSKRAIMLIFTVFLLFCLQTAAFADAEYSISNYAMEISVLPDGSAEVKETLIYEFDGEYNGILSLFDTDGIDGIEDFRVYADGEEVRPVEKMEYERNTYTAEEDGSLTEVRVYSPGRSGTRLFAYEYTMTGLADRYEDAGMILRKFIGENNSVSLQNAVVTVQFPEAGEVRAFVHGGMNESHIVCGENSVSFGPATVYPDSSVEMRILFPAEWIPDAPLKEGGIVDAALAEEQRLIEEAARRAELIRTAKYVFAAAYILGFFLIWLALVKKYSLKGRFHETPDIRRMTALPAAFASYAVEGAADTDSLSGTLMELVQRGIVRMENADGDVLFTLLDRSADGLYPHQQKLISWLFDECDSFSLSALNAGDDYDRAHAFESGYNSYCNQVAADMAAHSLRFKNDGVRITANAFLIILGALGTGFILMAGKANIALGMATALMMFLLLFLMSKIRALTDDGERLQAAALDLKSRPVAQDGGMLDLLPWYTALGMTEPLVEAVERIPADDHSSGNYLPLYLYAGWHHSLHTLSRSMRDTHHHNASVPDPNASSSSGSSGGSNGGGGGHGAW